MTKKTRNTNQNAAAEYGKILEKRRARRRCITSYDPENDKYSAMNMPFSSGELVISMVAVMQLFG